jgi:hypothetical protein
MQPTKHPFQDRKGPAVGHLPHKEIPGRGTGGRFASVDGEANEANADRIQALYCSTDSVEIGFAVSIGKPEPGGAGFPKFSIEEHGSRRGSQEFRTGRRGMIQYTRI